MSSLFWILLVLAWACIIGSFAARSSAVAALGLGFGVASVLVWAVEAGVLR